MQEHQSEEPCEGGSSGFKSGGRSGEVRIERTFSEDLKRGHPLVAYESAWVPEIRKIDWMAKQAGAHNQVLVRADKQGVLIERLDVREGELMDEDTWSGLQRTLLSHENCVFDPREVSYRISQQDIPEVVADSAYKYHPVKDEWVLRHLLYRHKSRDRVAEELDVARSKVEYWTNKRNIRFPWKNKIVMRDLYELFEGNSKAISKYLNGGEGTIRRWLKKHEIRETRPKDGIDESTLRELFVNQRHSRAEIGRKLGCSAGKVSYWLDKYEIRREDRTRDYLRYKSHKGYPCWFFNENGSKRRVRVHRLAAVAKFGVDSLEGMVVHHQSGVPWDNRLSNLELISNEKHAKHHNLIQND